MSDTLKEQSSYLIWDMNNCQEVDLYPFYLLIEFQIRERWFFSFNSIRSLNFFHSDVIEERELTINYIIGIHRANKSFYVNIIGVIFVYICSKLFTLLIDWLYTESDENVCWLLWSRVCPQFLINLIIYLSSILFMGVLVTIHLNCYIFTLPFHSRNLYLWSGTSYTALELAIWTGLPTGKSNKKAWVKSRATRAYSMQEES